MALHPYAALDGCLHPTMPGTATEKCCSAEPRFVSAIHPHYPSEKAAWLLTAQVTWSLLLNVGSICDIGKSRAVASSKTWRRLDLRASPRGDSSLLTQPPIRFAVLPRGRSESVSPICMSSQAHGISPDHCGFVEAGYRCGGCYIKNVKPRVKGLRV